MGYLDEIPLYALYPDRTLYLFMDLCILFVMLFACLILGDLGVSLVSVPSVVCLRRGTVASRGRGV